MVSSSSTPDAREAGVGWKQISEELVGQLMRIEPENAQLLPAARQDLSCHQTNGFGGSISVRRGNQWLTACDDDRRRNSTRVLEVLGLHQALRATGPCVFE